MTPDLPSYPDGVDDTGQGSDVVGYEVEATDGRIGTVDEATYEVGQSYLIIDTGPWVFGKKVMLPASIVTQIDPAERTIAVCRTRQEIKNAPEFDESAFKESAYRDTLNEYYRRFPYSGGP
ncbi:hypothetical protein Pth03_80310 [Planotetraspora thailandica]|uniref:PRC domain containing protein n=1 Tax=Planotetraspora thailandica TaxID=487172 RepID=A0A8J4DGI0_9ACTN|nr:PRC-barrel domain-containing protein [Planotetraspora thailandica]GII59642.1 hypothetical protein Pth03_80310 [Planotetraspora thailandica]